LDLPEIDFAAPWGTMLKVMSSIGTLVLVGIPAFMLTDIDIEADMVMGIGGIAICLITLISTLLFTIRGFTVSGSTLLVRRLLWNTRLDLTGLKSVTVDRNAMKGSIKTLGNGGLFSFSGSFRSRSLGKFRAFVTDMSSCVVLELQSGKVVISPENPEYFVSVVSGS